MSSVVTGIGLKAVRLRNGALVLFNGGHGMVTENYRVSEIQSVLAASLQRIAAGLQVGSPSEEARQALDLASRINAAASDDEIADLVR